MTVTLQNFEEICRKNGLRMTPQRRWVFKVLLDSNDHPSTEDIFLRVREQLPNVSFDTVNRTLQTLSDIGVAGKLIGSGQPRRYDARTDYHYHMQCRRCGAIVDLEPEEFEAFSIPKNIKNEFKISHYQLYLDGLCPRCQKW